MNVSRPLVQVPFESFPELLWDVVQLVFKPKTGHGLKIRYNYSPFLKVLLWPNNLAVHPETLTELPRPGLFDPHHHKIRWPFQGFHSILLDLDDVGKSRIGSIRIRLVP